MWTTIPAKADETTNGEDDDVLRNLPVQESIRWPRHADSAEPARLAYETSDAHP